MENTCVPFSSIVVADNMAFISGQLPVDEKGLIVEGIGNQTKQCLSNMFRVLQTHNLGLEDIVKVTVFLTDFTKFDEMNKEYIKFFGNLKPARSACGVTALARNASIEIDCIAIKKN